MGQPPLEKATLNVRLPIDMTQSRLRVSPPEDHWLHEAYRAACVQNDSDCGEQRLLETTLNQ